MSENTIPVVGPDTLDYTIEKLSKIMSPGGANIDFPITIEQGGTGAETLEEAQDVLGISSINDITTGVNLLRGTRDFTVGTISYGTLDGLKLDGFFNIISSTGRSVITKQDDFSILHYDGSWNGASYGWTNVLLPEQINGDGITISFEFMVEQNPSNNANLIQIVKMTDGDASKSQELKLFQYRDAGLTSDDIEVGKWYKIVLHYDEKFNFSENEYLRIGIITSNTDAGTRVSNWRKFKAERGHIENPEWSASPFDLAQQSQWINGAPKLLGECIEIPENSDINDYITPGSYRSSLATGSTLSNIPEQIKGTYAFTLDVSASNGTVKDGVAHVHQKITTHNNEAIVFFRYGSRNIESGKIIYNFQPWRQTYANTTVRPIEGGGTGATNAAAAWTALGGGSVGKLNTNGTATTYLNGSGQWTTPANTDTNVTQNHSTGNAEYPILLKNGTTTGNITSTALFDADVTINPSTGVLTARVLRPMQGQYIHTAQGTAGTAGVVAIARIVVSQTYTNTPLYFKFFRRGSAASCDVYIMFSNAASNDPGLGSIKYIGTDYAVAINKVSTSTWDLYVTKSEAYDEIQVVDFYCKYSTVNSGISVSWTNTHATAIPSTAVKATPFYDVATTSASGFAPKLNGTATTYLNGAGNWTTPPNTNTWTAFVGASASSAGTAGYVPAAGTGNQAKFFRGDGTWQVPTNTTYGTVSTSATGLCPKLTGSTTVYLNGNGAWTTPPNTTYGAVSTSAAGLCPKLTGSTTAYLNANGAWTTPPNTNTWTAFAGASASSAGTAGYVPAPGTGNQNKFFRANGTWTDIGTVVVSSTEPTDASVKIWITP